MIRLILSSKEGQEEEEVFFTDDLESDVSEFLTPGFSVDIDQEIEDLPDGFPINHSLTVNF